MIGRRDFLKGAVVTVSVLGLGSATQSLASSAGPYTNIIYTSDNPGKWGAKVKTHAPEVTVAEGKVAVKTVHPMSAEHFIVRHTLVLADGTVVGAATFKHTDKPESAYELPTGYKGKVFATSFCNLHDFWLTEFTV